MTLQFPNSPSLGDTYEANNIVYTWDGEKWVTSSSGGQIGTKGAVAYGCVSSSNTLTGGYNIASTSYTAGTLSVTFATEMNNNNYTVVATFDTARNSAGSDAVWLATTNQTTTGFDIVVKTMSVDTRTSAATQAIVLRNDDTLGVSFAVFGGN
jgi:hypothetical protein